MPQHLTFTRFTLCLLILASSQGQPVNAQTGFDQTIEQADGPLTIINVELLTQGIDAGQNPQRWGRAFDEIGISCRIRQGLADEVASIDEEQDGRIRRINIVGLLDRQGRVTFPDASFTLADQVEFRNWISDLETYGVQGSPDGQANWGLDEPQLVQLLEYLSRPITAEVKGLPVTQALDQFPFPEGMELRMTLAPALPGEAAPSSNLPRTATLAYELKGISLGTGLAILLSQQGLGFEPVRNPDGSIDLQVVPLTEERNPWPIGWDLGESTPRDAVFPTLFEFFPINIQDVSLSQTLSVISERSGVPIFLDYRLCDQREVDVEATRITVIERQSAWGLVMRRVVSQAHLTFDYRLDEADKPFLWVYPFVPFTPIESE